MKASHLIPYLMTIAVITGCIKEDGEPYTIMREIDTTNTLVSSLKGYMYGTAQKSEITKDTFELKIGASQIEDLDVYLGLKSSVYVYDTSHIVQCGYVYSYTNTNPTVGQDSTCKLFENITWNSANNHDSIKFEGEQHNLKFNSDIHIRPFVVNQAGDTCYSPRTINHTTSKPSNVWFRRKDAMLSARSEAISATTNGGLVYVYGGRGNMECYSDMWVYNSTNDTWEQKATFSEKNTYFYTRPVERCNGAA